MNDIEFKMRMEKHGKEMKNFVKPPFDICEETAKKEREKMKKTVSHGWVKKTIYGAAGAAAAFVLTVNCIPNLAYAMSGIPILDDVIRVVTFGRFEVKESNYEAKIVTPKIEGLLDKEMEEKINREFKENADAVIYAFEQDVKELKSEYGADGFHFGVESNYMVRTDNDNILAIDSYIINMAGSSSTRHSFYNIDKKTGTLIELSDLFKENADYVTPISEYLIGEMRKENESGEGGFWIEDDDPDAFRKIKDDQNFFINDSGNIVICFDKYEVAIGALGCPEFEIPSDVIADILK